MIAEFIFQSLISVKVLCDHLMNIYKMERGIAYDVDEGDINMVAISEINVN